MSCGAASVAPGVGDFTQPEEFAGATPAALRALRPAERVRSAGRAAAGDQVPAARPGPARRLQGPGRASSTPTTNALPRVFVVDRQRTVARRRGRARRGHRAGLRRPAGGGHRDAGCRGCRRRAPPARRRAAPRTLRTYEPERVVIDATTPRPRPAGADRRLLPGLEGDGRRARRPRSSAWTTCCAGCALTPGHHTVVLRYQPASWRIGWIVSLVALLGLAGSSRGRRGSRAGAGGGGTT